MKEKSPSMIRKTLKKYQKKDKKVFYMIRKKKIISAKDKNSHHKQNYLVIFGTSGIDGLKALVNASDKTNALRIALNRYVRAYPEKEITRARVAGVYENGKKRIGKRIGVNMDFDQ